MIATRDDVVECYRRILGREPENDAVIDRYVAKNLEQWVLIQIFLDTEERKMRESPGNALSIMKCTRNVYIAKSIPRQERKHIFLDNLEFLRLTLEIQALEDILYREITLIKNGNCDVIIQFARDIFVEGEISIRARYNGRDIYVCSFTFVRGRCLGVDRDWVVLVSRMQGYAETKDPNRLFAEAFHGIASRYVVFHALAGIVKSSKLDTLVGVSARNQVCSNDHLEESLRKNYDEFFNTFRGVQSDEDLYKIKVPLEGKNILQIKPSHRARARERHRLKAEIAETTEARWSELTIGGRQDGREEAEPQDWDRAASGGIIGGLQRFLAGRFRPRRATSEP